MEGITITLKDGVKTIKFNQLRRKNAINRQIYIKLTNTLNEDALDDAIIATIITGEGDYFSSGNDINAVLETGTQDSQENLTIAREANHIFEKFVQALINYPKLLIAVVNGPAVGIAVTMLGLCDVVYASDRATFHTPFVKLGLCCEGCSSYIFPFFMGRSKASEMLLLGRKMSAQEAFENNFVARVIPHEKLGELFQELQSCGKLPLKSVLVNKKLILDGLKDTLHSCNRRECEVLLESTQSEDFFNAVMEFMSRKNSKL